MFLVPGLANCAQFCSCLSVWLIKWRHYKLNPLMSSCGHSLCDVEHKTSMLILTTARCNYKAVTETRQGPQPHWLDEGPGGVQAAET